MDNQTQLNPHFQGARFELNAMRAPSRHILFKVPVAIRDGKPSAMHQVLGVIRRKNDGRFSAFRKPNKTFFEGYPNEPVYEKVFTNLIKAQEWIVAGAPKEAEANVTMLTDDEMFKFWHAFQS